MGVYVCSEEGCRKTYTTRESLEIHIEGTHRRIRHCCTEPGCGKSYAQKRTLHYHTKHDHEGIRHCCTKPGCGKSYGKKQSLEDHTKHAHEGISHCCTEPGCGKSYTAKQSLHTHQQGHEGIRHCCTKPGCGKAFATTTNLKVHTEQAHLGIARCCTEPGCGKTFSSKKSLNAHTKKVHNGINQYCTEPGCDKSFKKKHSVLIHIARDHRQIRPHACTEPGCGKQWTTTDALKKHMNTHGRLLNCPEKDCGYTYKRRSDLNRHTKRAHQGNQSIHWAWIVDRVDGTSQNRLRDHHMMDHQGENGANIGDDGGKAATFNAAWENGSEKPGKQVSVDCEPLKEGVRVGRHYTFGDLLGEFIGELAPLAALGSFPDGYVIDPTCPDLDKHGKPVKVCDINPNRCNNWARKQNHSCGPNAEFKSMRMGGKWKVMVSAVKDIRAGEEVLVWYGAGDWKDHDIECACGSEGCVSKQGDGIDIGNGNGVRTHTAAREAEELEADEQEAEEQEMQAAAEAAEDGSEARKEQEQASLGKKRKTLEPAVEEPMSKRVKKEEKGETMPEGGEDKNDEEGDEEEVDEGLLLCRALFSSAAGNPYWR